MIPHVSLKPSNVRSSACGDEEISLRISRQSKGRSMVFSDLAKEGSQRTESEVDQSKVSFKRCTSQDNLSRFGIESPFEMFPPDDAHDASSHSDASTLSSSASSASESEFSTDLNSFSSTGASDADGDSILYELFPASSFSSLAAIKCNDVDESRFVLTCADRTASCSKPYADELCKAEALVREHNGVKPSMYAFDEDDSIIECVEDSHESVSANY
jgi:hypothetical protein